MKQTLILLLLAISSTLSAQNFEGTITYSTDIKVSEKFQKMGITKEILKSKMESEGEWFDSIKVSYKEGFYKQANFSSNESWIIYNPDSIKRYTFQNGEGKDLCVVSDATVDLEFKMTGKMPTVTLLDSVVKGEKYDMEIVKVKWSTGAYYYLFNEDMLKANPEDYKGHVYDGFYEFLKISNAYPLVIVKDVMGMMEATITVTSIDEKEIDSTIFDLPELEVDDELSGLNLGVGTIMKIKR